MSIQAVAWALEQQDFLLESAGGRKSSAHAAKLVLISLANHADHVSGHCWPSGETIAREASITPRSVYRLTAALARNGFIEIRKVKGADGKQRSNNYWIRFDRPRAPWKFYSPDADDPDDPQDMGGPGDNESPGESGSAPVENTPESDESRGSESPGPSNKRVTRHIMIEPSESEPSLPDSSRETPESSPAKGASEAQAIGISTPLTFDPKLREAEVRRDQSAGELRKAALVFVIEGTRAWLAWKARKTIETKRPWNLVTNGTVQGKPARGWYFPTLFPPPDPDEPPPGSLMTREDMRGFK